MKKYIILLCVTLTAVLSGCGRALPLVPADGSDVCIVEVKQDGSVLCHVEGSFEESYYSKESLQSFVQSEVADYCKEHPDTVSIEKIDVDGKRAVIELRMKTGEDFGEFDGHTFYCGTVDDAKKSGYDFNVTMHPAGDMGSNVSPSDIEDMGSRKLIICDEPLALVLSGKALYVSDNVTLIEKKTVTTPADQVSYIIYK